MDKSSFAGILIASGAIYLGLTLEGGKLGQILQPTAALIVFGGTLGAVMLQFPLRVVIAAFLRLGHVFLDHSKDPQLLIAEIVEYAQKARKDGIVSLDRVLEEVEDPFLKKSLMLAVDGTEPQEIRKWWSRSSTIKPSTRRTFRKYSSPPEDSVPPSESSAPCSASFK